jgi:hypothetical protein
MGTLKKLIAKFIPFMVAAEALATKKHNINMNLERAYREKEIAVKRGKNVFAYGGCMASNDQAIFIPKRTKRKYWMV